jgi:hypothetical protein
VRPFGFKQAPGICPLSDLYSDETTMLLLTLQSTACLSVAAATATRAEVVMLKLGKKVMWQ